MAAGGQGGRAAIAVAGAVMVAGAACALLAGCGSASLARPGAGGPGGGGGTVAVTLVPPNPDPAGRKLCAALSRQLPAALDGHTRRTVNPSSQLTAAWGSPPIALRCGVPRPADLTPTAELTVVNGVLWFPGPAGSAAGSRFTEVGRQAYVELTVPTRYSPAGPILVAISNAIASAVPAKPDGAI